MSLGFDRLYVTGIGTFFFRLCWLVFIGTVLGDSRSFLIFGQIAVAHSVKVTIMKYFTLQFYLIKECSNLSKAKKKDRNYDCGIELWLNYRTKYRFRTQTGSTGGITQAAKIF